MKENDTTPGTSEPKFSKISDLIKKERKYLILIIITSLSLLMSVLLAVLNIGNTIPLLLGAISSILLAFALWYIIKIMGDTVTTLGETYALRTKQEALITDFSHRMREPLNSLAILGDLLMETKTNEHQMELLQTLVASNNNLATVLNELTMQSAQSFSYESRKDISFNIQSTVRNTIELFRRKEDSNIDFILSDDALEDQICIGNPIILKQILLDLFNSIVSLTRETQIRLMVGISVAPGKGTLKQYTFTLDSDVSFSLFNNDLSYEPLASKLIEKEGGNLEETVQSDSTSISFSMPFTVPEPRKKEEDSASRIVELVKKEPRKKKISDLNVLVVEDNPINQKILILTLKELVKNIDTAINGKEALDKFGKSRYDLILMDIQMPVMDGLIAVEKIRELEKYTGAHTPIIAVTANAMLGDKEKCISAGMDEYLSKPLQPGDLIGVIERVIHS